MCQNNMSRKVSQESSSSSSMISSRMHQKCEAGNSSVVDENANVRGRSLVYYTVAGTFTAMVSFVFSIELTKACVCWTDLYQPANFIYDSEWTKFDNSAWTYVTDYILAVIMMCYACSKRPTNFSVSSKLDTNLRCLLVCYFVSVTSGGVSHQFFTSIEDMNSVSFRLMWILCVGTVTLASGFIGAMGSNMSILLRNEDPLTRNIPRLPQHFWYTYGIILTAIDALGYLSLKRPACDIFIAGTMQTFPTIYFTLNTALYLRQEESVPTLPKVMNMLPAILFAFYINAPLLPLYPVFSLFMDLPAVNTLLHTWLAVAWSCQANCVKDLQTLITMRAMDGSKRS